MSTGEEPRAVPARRRVLQWTAIGIGTLVVALLLTAAVLDANADALRGPIARMASAHLGRPVHLDGRLELHLLSWNPRLVARGVRVENPRWLRQPPDLLRIGELQVSLSLPALLKGDILLPYIGVDDSDIVLVRESQNRANWDLSNSAAQPAAKPARLPLLGALHLGPGRLVVRDEVRKLKFSGSVAADQASHGAERALTLRGDGTINGETFQLTATGDPLITAENHKPYTVASDIRAGKTRVRSTITVAKPFDLGSVVADISASGDDLADLYYLTGLALPNTAAYRVSGHLRRAGTLLKLTDFRGTLGQSDIHGTLSIETGRARPLLTADLATRLLDIKDLGPTLGSQVKTTPSSLSRPRAGSGESAEESTAKARAAAPHAATTSAQGNVTGAGGAADQKGGTQDLHGAKPEDAETRSAEAREADARAAKGETLLPDAKLDLKRIRGMDARVKYRAAAVKTQEMSIDSIVLDLNLDNGILKLTPVSFMLPQGKLTADVVVDGAKDVPEVDIDARVTGVKLSQFKTKAGQQPLDGTLVGRAILHGHGRSLHELGATTDGTLSVAVPHGDIRSAFAELLGINAARGLGLLLSGNQDKTAIRCGVANFKAQGGVFAAQDMVIDTTNVLILGKGQVDLGPETLDLTLNGQPKKVRFFRIKSPVELSGTLSRPKVGVKPGNTPGQVVLATALGVLATPLAAVLAFIDPGLAKDADCGSLLAEAQRQGAPQVRQLEDRRTGPPREAAPMKNAQRSTKARSMT